MKQENQRSICIFVFVLSLLAAGGAFGQGKSASKANEKTTPAPALTLRDYLEQVSTKHLGLKAAGQTAEAARLYSGEWKTLYAPTLVGNGQRTSEGPSNPLSPGDRFNTSGYSLGVSQQTNFGLSGKLSYNYSSIDFPNMLGYNTGYGQLDLSQSLLRNFGGAEVRAQADLAEATAMAKSFTQSYVSKSLTLEAEAAYWRLALARELVQMQKDAVDRAEKIAAWTNRRARLQLTDRAESLQASTNLQARRLDFKNAQDDERTAAQAFNASRGLLNDRVEERLVDLTPDLIARLRVPDRHDRRDDVKAAEYSARASAANSNLSREKDKPTFEVFGSSILTEPKAPTAQQSAVLPASSRPASVIGLRLTAPLNVSTLKRAREGHAAEAQAAEWTYQRKVFEEDRDWQDLSAKFRESKERFKLYSDLERTQKEKLDYERDRQQRGRSTLQQVLLFETDFEAAQLGRIRTLADLLTLNAQMKLYGVSYESR